MINLDSMASSAKSRLLEVLEELCQVLDLSPSLHGTVEGRYKAVGAWLAEGESPLLKGALVYPQGSTALGTAVKPVLGNEHDVDLVCHLPHLSREVPPEVVRRVIGDRLRTNATYARMLEPKTRCWRLHYAGEFHLDITPSVPNPACWQGGECVPDRDLRDWKATNPRGYRLLFEELAARQPRLRFTKSATLDERRGTVEAFPALMERKGILRRAVQLAKRHRDLHFAERPELAPISVVITTLASRSYAECVGARVYDNEFDVLADVIRRMPEFFDRTPAAGGAWVLVNETTTGENFAEKWNVDPALPRAFDAWHQRASAEFDRWCELRGEDLLIKSLGDSFGAEPVKQAFESLGARLDAARQTGGLRIVHGAGIIRSASVGTQVQPNTFYGAE